MRKQGSLLALYAAILLLVALPQAQADHCALSGCTPSASAICGVEVCGACYHCGIEGDGICPASFAGSGKSCAVCDPECIPTGPENTLAVCNPAQDCKDNDGDGLKNWDDFTSDSNNPGSCNVCNAAACQAVGGAFANTVLTGTGSSNPGTSGVIFRDGTTAQPGSASSFRLDNDGLSGPSKCWCGECDRDAGYYFNASTGTCQRNATACAITAEPVLNFRAVPNNVSPTRNFEVFDTTLILGATTDPGLSYVFEIDTNSDTSAYEHSNTRNTSVAKNGLLQGTHTFYARVTDNCFPTPRNRTASVTVPVAPNTPPYVSDIQVSQTPKWRSADVNISYRVYDNQGPVTTGLTVWNSSGTPRNIVTTSNPGEVNEQVREPQRTYTTGTYTINITSTDSGTTPLRGTNTTTFSAVGLPCVQGTPTGNATYDDLQEQCCSNSCSREINGWWTCFAVNSCDPATAAGTMCANPGPAFVDRDSSETICEASSSTCSLLTWSDLNQSAACCGDDANEHLAVRTWNGAQNNPPTTTTNACCSAPGMCYTTAGIAGCYVSTAENTVATCRDGIDNDCNGLLDRTEPGCYAASVSGTIRYYNEQTKTLDTTPSGGSRADTSIWISNDNRTNTIPGYNVTYSFSAPTYTTSRPGDDGLWIGNPERKITISRPGYKTMVSAPITLSSGSAHTVNFNLTPRRCDRYCMNDEGFCDITCIGVGECQPSGPLPPQADKRISELAVLEACHPTGAPFGLRSGTEVVMGVNETSQEILVGLCCAVAPPQWRKAPAVTAEENLNIDKISTLVKFTRLVTLNGKTYKLVISTWDS